MHHVESSIKIFFTKEYARFKMINGNRQLNEVKIKKIIDDIDEGLDVLKYSPIIVVEKDGRLEIIDGQHRFFVAKKLGSHVWYIIASEFSLHEIAKINSNTEKWRDKDFINCYAQQGNQHYIDLRDFKEQWGFPTTICIKLLQTGTVLREGGATGKDKFQAGQFEVLALDKANEVAATVKLFFGFPKYRSGPFVEAICKILRSGVVDINDIVAKWKKNEQALIPQANAKDYLTNLESIYNLNARARKVIYE